MTTSFFDTALGQRISSEQRLAQHRYNAALMAEVSEQHQPWPVIDSVREVTFRTDMNDAGKVVIDVIDGNWRIITRSRPAQDAIVEAAGYAARAGWNFSPMGELPAVFVTGFLALTEKMAVQA